jgi:pimeloyl-ACP methyl ester carboxylesterase
MTIAAVLAVRRPDLVRAVIAHEAPWRFTRRLPPFPEEWRCAGRESGAAALADLWSSIGEYPSAADLATVRVPIVCSYGARSADSMFLFTRSLAAAIPTARVHPIEGPASSPVRRDHQLPRADRRDHHLLN